MGEKQLKRIANYQKCFETKEGKAVLIDLIDKYFFSSEAQTNDTNMTFFAAGQRALVKHILDLLKFNANDLYKKLEKERMEASDE